MKTQEPTETEIIFKISAAYFHAVALERPSPAINVCRYLRTTERLAAGFHSNW